jgi:hypothetical protein
MFRWINNSKEKFAGLIILALLVILWQSLRFASSYSPYPEYAKNRHLEAVRQVSPSILKPGDNVFLSTQNSSIQEAIARSGANVYKFDSKDTAGFDAALLKVLDERCRLDPGQAQSGAYFIWTKDNELAAMDLSHAARNLNFFYFFQAVLPYRGADAFAIDDILRLQPKEGLIDRYCEARRLGVNKQVLMIIDTNDFSPWIGSVKTGPVTWLASDPTRNMAVSDFAVKDLPPLLTYDVYWMGQLSFIPYWTFTHQDRAAYEEAVKQAKSQGSVVLVDKGLKLGASTQTFLEQCASGQPPVKSKILRQMCLR